MKNKVYCYFMIADHIDANEYPGILYNLVNVELNTDKEYVLYAYATDPEDAIAFEFLRDMKLFYKKVIELSDKELEEFCDYYTELDFHEQYLTTMCKSFGVRTIKKVAIPCTMYEYLKVTYTKSQYIRKIIEDITPEYLGSSYIFNEELQEALDTLLYSDLMEEVFFPIDTSSPFNYNEYKINELSLFIRLFHNTFRKSDSL